jgi:hypothetical protein
MYIGTERRQCRRYKAGGMNANISFQDESSGKVCVERVNPVDFNSFGMSIETNLDLEIESRISLDISKGNNHASNIICIVCYVENQGKNNRYGLQFDFAANEYMYSDELEETLANIEKNLKKNQNDPYRNLYRRIKTRSR